MAAEEVSTIGRALGKKNGIWGRFSRACDVINTLVSGFSDKFIDWPIGELWKKKIGVQKSLPSCAPCHV